MTLTRKDRLVLWSPFAVFGVFALVPIVEDGPTICPFALTTGMACPGCGMTRAAAQLFRGDIGAATTLHPLVPAIALLALGGWIWFWLRRTGRAQPMSSRVLNGILISTLIALVAVWIVRLATGGLPDV